MVRRPSHARVLAAVATARLAAGAAVDGCALGRGRHRVLHGAGAPPLRPGGGATGHDVVRRRVGHAAVHQPAPVRTGHSLRPGGRAGASARPARAGAAAGSPERGVQPRGRAVRRHGRARHTRSPRAARGSRSSGVQAWRWPPARSCLRSLLSLAFPEGGYAPFPFSSYLPIPLFAVVALLLLPRSEHTLRVAAVLYARGVHAGPGHPHGDGRQRRPHGGPDRRAAAGVRAGRPRRLAQAGRADRGGARRARVLAVVPRCEGHLQGGHRPGGQGVLLRPGARVPAPASRPAPRGDPVHARALGGGRGGLRGAAGARLATPAGHRTPSRSSTRAG